MAQLPKPTLLRTLRKRSGLTQDEFAFVVGVSDGQMSRFELGDQVPSGTVIVGSHVVFGAWADVAFVDFYVARESAVLENTKYLARHLSRRSDSAAIEKLAFLNTVLEKRGSVVGQGTVTGKPPQEETILALSIGAAGSGFVVLRSGEMVDFGTKRPQRIARKASLAGMAWLLKRHQPDRIVLIKKRGTGTLVAERISDLMVLAKEEAIPIVRYSRRDIRGCFRVVGAETKEEIAREVARRFPEIRLRLPKPRKPWMPEQPAMLLFEAASLAVVRLVERGEFSL